MFKKDLILVGLLVALSSTTFAAGENLLNLADRPSVAVIISYPQNLHTPAMKDMVIDRFKEAVPATIYSLQIGEPVSAKMREYMEKKRILNPALLTKDDLVAFAKENQYQYMIFCSVAQGNMDVGSGGFNVSVKSTIDFRARIIDVDSENAAFDRIYTEQGKHSTTPGLFGGIPSWQKAAMQSVDQALYKLFTDRDATIKFNKPAKNPSES